MMVVVMGVAVVAEAEAVEAVDTLRQCLSVTYRQARHQCIAFAAGPTHPVQSE